MKKILFVDDDHYFARFYVDELRKFFEVVCVYEIGEALDILRADDSFSAAIVDVMMPPPIGFEAETHNGASSGIWLLNQVRNEIIQRNLPVIVLSNHTIRRIEQELDCVSLPSNLITVSSKVATEPSLLPHLVRAAIARGIPRNS
ncbi:MAG: response regulator [Akkermansiaceae bacterium]|nr:response regulator [Akkermansiaceae bacterium]